VISSRHKFDVGYERGPTRKTALDLFPELVLVEDIGGRNAHLHRTLVLPDFRSQKERFMEILGGSYAYANYYFLPFYQRFEGYFEFPFVLYT
jgi:hypothetical protein